MVVTKPEPRRAGGCLKWVLLGVLGVVLIIAVALGSVFLALSNSDAAQMAFDRAGANPLVTSALDSPLRRGWITSGSIKVQGSSGEVDIAVPISGPSGSGTVYVRGKKEAGRWLYDLIEADVGNASRIDLREEPRR
jgi:hypothetical protein